MLYNPFDLAGLRLKNRIVRSAMYEKLADHDGGVTDGLISLYQRLARGGAGLLITGGAIVHHLGRQRPAQISAHADSFGDGLRRLTDAVHEEGGLIVAQLSHAGPHAVPVLIGQPKSLGPSNMTEPEIREAIDSFADAAWRAQQAGFDAVQIHAAHGQLISSFLNPNTNLRDDYWGGDEERRSHLMEDIVIAVRESVGDEYPVLIKINASFEGEADMSAVNRLMHLPVDAVEITGGTTDVPITGGDELPGGAYYKEEASLVRASGSLPIILTGGIRTRAQMDEILDEGSADLVGLGRPLLREPELPNLIADGKDGSDCESCLMCARLKKLRYIRCKKIAAGDAL